jgi:hypothetical protein
VPGGPSEPLAIVASMRRSSEALRKPVPGRLFELVKWVSWVELAIFAALIAFWLLPGFDNETFIFGLTHGIGYILLCLLIWVTALRHEAPYTLLAATLTPVGPLGSVIAVELIERKGWGVAPREAAAVDARLQG